jgi:hypothetical protein
MIRNEKVRTAPWDPLAMKQLNEALVAEMDELRGAHSDLTDTPLSTPVTMRARVAVADRGQRAKSLQAAWFRMEHARVEAAAALKDLLRHLVRPDEPGKPRQLAVPDLRPIAVVLPQTERGGLPAQVGFSSEFERVDHMRRIRAHDAETKLEMFKATVGRYKDEKAVAAPRIRHSLRVEQGLGDDEIARLEQFDAIEAERERDAARAELLDAAREHEADVLAIVDQVQP